MANLIMIDVLNIIDLLLRVIAMYIASYLIVGNDINKYLPNFMQLNIYTT